MPAAVLALLASLSWGTSDYLAGLEARRSTAWTVALGGQVAASLSLLGLLAVLAPVPPSPGALLAPLAGGTIGGAGVLLYYRALSLTSMTVVSPIVASAALVPVLWGIIGGERPGPVRVIGIAVTLAGVALIARRPRGESPARRPGARSGIVAAVAAAAAFGIFLVALDHGEAGGLWTVAVARTTAMLALVDAAGLARPAVSFRRRALPVLVVVGLLIAAANVLFTSAASLGHLSVVGVLGWLNPAVTMLWARALLHERLTPLQLGAAGLVFAGIVCLVLG